MRCRLHASLAILLALVVGVTRFGASQSIELASRAPRFLAVSPASGKPVDASNAAVLQRRVSLDLTSVTVDVALAEIGRRAGVGVMYSKDVLPTNRRVSVAASSLTVAAALTEALLGTGLDVLISPDGQLALIHKLPELREEAKAPGTIVGRVTDAKTQTALAGATVVVEATSRSAITGNDGRYRIADVASGTYTVRARFIGYAPGSASVTVTPEQEATADFGLEKSAQRLDEVVTTGTVVPTEVKALPTPISIVTADDIQRKNLQRLDQVFRGDVPGAVAWDPGPGVDNVSVISVRGASTLIANPSIKTFIDGVEVADPQFIATIDPNSVDRIEIIRGPQASTLYGAGALSGVMQIFTKKGRLGQSRPEVSGKISVGGTAGYDGGSSAAQTDNTMSVLGGSEKASYNLGASYRHLGEWVPSYRSSDWGISAGGQTVQGPFTLASSLRYSDGTFDWPWDTRFQAYTYFSKPFYNTTQARGQTYGVTASLQASRNWKHTITLGYDQMYVSRLQTQARLTTPADSLLSVLASHTAKVSLLYHTDLSISLGSSVVGTVTAGVNHDAYDYVLEATFDTPRTQGYLDGSTQAQLTPWKNTGYFGQVQLGVADRLFLTGGLRAEQNDNFGSDLGMAWSPRIGVAYAVGSGPARAKLRASYGESIRAPSPGQREGSVTPFAIQLPNPGLAPERQRGADAGVEIYIGPASLQATYYNQRAIDLIDIVTLPPVPGALPTEQYQNISRVKNEGWEFEGHLPLGAFELGATYSITNSTVRALPAGYTGDYRIGDKVLAVPHTSAGATLTYSPLRRTTLSASMTYIGHWTNTDILSFYASIFGGQPYRGSTRAYWMEYPTVTKIAIGLSQEFRRGVTGFVRAENVGNTLRAEQYNYGIPTPRSVVVGAYLRY